MSEANPPIRPRFSRVVLPPSRSLAVEGLIVEDHFAGARKPIPANQGLVAAEHFADDRKLLTRGIGWFAGASKPLTLCSAPVPV
jgi:hypothetical protein